MIKTTAFLFLFLWITNVFSGEPAVFSKSGTVMGTSLSINVVTENEGIAELAFQLAFDEFIRIEKLISSWDSTSQTSLINKNAGINPVKVDKELYQLIKRSIKISKLTEGAFDITTHCLSKLWRFEGQNTKLPESNDIEAKLSLVDYRNIQLNDTIQSVFLTKEGMSVGFGAIGKGYAVNKAVAVLQKMGIKAGVVNAGGDLRAWGNKPDGSSWKVGIKDPNDAANIYSWLDVQDMAVVTSGDYERYFMYEGIRYAHILNPKSGWPSTGIKSVTVICKDAELADALATSVFVLGKEKGIELINQLNQIEAIIVTDENEFITSLDLTINPIEIK